MSVTGVRQSTSWSPELPGLRVLACPCPVERPGKARGPPCCVFLVNDAFACGYCERAFSGRYGLFSFVGRRVRGDSLAGRHDPVPRQRTYRPIACRFPLSDAPCLRCGHDSLVLLRKKPAHRAGQGRIYWPRGRAYPAPSRWTDCTPGTASSLAHNLVN